MNKSVIYVLFSLFLVFCITGTSLAGDASGYWRSSTGWTIKLWSNMQQVHVKFIGSNGQTYKYYGWWTKLGQQFAYKINSTVQTCTFTGPSTISNYGTDGSYYTWTRVGQRSTRQTRSYSAPAPSGGAMDPASWNNMVERNRANNNGYVTTTAPAPSGGAMDPASWNNMVERNRANNNGYVTTTAPAPSGGAMDPASWNNMVESNRARQNSTPKTSKSRKSKKLDALFEDLGNELLDAFGD